MKGGVVLARRALVIIICLLLVIILPLHFASSHHRSNPTIANNTGVPDLQLNNNSHQKNISRYLFPPSEGTKLIIENSHISPVNYNHSPAPMGISDMGLMKINGNVTAFNVTTASVRGNLKVDNISFPQFQGGNFSVQLNSVLHDVRISGTTYQLWTQNVAIIDARAGTIELVDNIWDLNYGMMGSTIIKSGNGSFYPTNPLVYIDYGPTLHFKLPFVLNITTTSVVLGSNDAIKFNYSLNSSAGSYKSSYDTAVINNHVSYGEPTTYLISGNSLVTPWDAYDAEWVIGGPQGAMNADFTNLSGSMNLYTRNGSVYVPVNASFDYGVDTGETCAGVDITWKNTTAILGGGPSYLYGMWNLSGTSNFTNYSVSISPSNAFAFVGNILNGTGTNYTWLPTGPSGKATFSLIPGNYSLMVILSGHSVFTGTLNLTGNRISLSPNNSTGAISPLYAFNSSQVAAISTSGNGTVANQYNIINATSGNGTRLNRLFTVGNSFGYDIFPGSLMIMDTSSYIHISDSPFDVSLSNTHNISITGTSDQIHLIDSSGDLVFNNSIQGTVELSNSSGNYISGNRFVYSGLMPQNIQSEVFLRISGQQNYIINNIFESLDPVVSDSTSPNGTPLANIFNVSASEFENGFIVNGFNLSRGGYITNVTGGNLWLGYKGTGPYSDGQMNGIDASPSVETLLTAKMALQPANFFDRYMFVDLIQFNVFVGLGLPGSGYNAYLPLNSTYDLPSANYTCSVFPFLGNLSPFYGIELSYSPAGLNISAGTHQSFLNVTAATEGGYLMSVGENGLPNGTAWSIAINKVSTPKMGTNPVLLLVPNGSYNYTVSSPPGFYTENGTVNVSGSPSYLNITFLPYFHLRIMVSPTNASVAMDGKILSLQDGGYNATLKLGNYAFNATAKGYKGLQENLSITNSTPHILYLNLTPNQAAPPGFPVKTYLLIGIPVVLGIAAISYFIRRRK